MTIRLSRWPDSLPVYYCDTFLVGRAVPIITTVGVVIVGARNEGIIVKKGCRSWVQVWYGKLRKVMMSN
jgi:hypothetical protein